MRSDLFRTHRLRGPTVGKRQVPGGRGCLAPLLWTGGSDGKSEHFWYRVAVGHQRRGITTSASAVRAQQEERRRGLSVFIDAAGTELYRRRSATPGSITSPVVPRSP